MDIRIKSDEGRFKFRTCGVIVKNNKILLDRSRVFDGFVFPGGHVSMGENTFDAVVREVQEEIGVRVKINKLICVHENVFKEDDGKIFHEIAYYFLLDLLDTIPENDFEFFEIDGEKEFNHKYTWIEFDKMIERNVRPSFIPKLLQENRENYFILTDTIKGFVVE